MRLQEYCDRVGLKFNMKETADIVNNNIQELDMSPEEWIATVYLYFPENESVVNEYRRVVYGNCRSCNL